MRRPFYIAISWISCFVLLALMPNLLRGQCTATSGDAPTFTCDAAPVEVSFLEPDAPGTMFFQRWQGVVNTAVDPQRNYFGPNRFDSGTPPVHASGTTPATGMYTTGITTGATALGKDPALDQIGTNQPAVTEQLQYDAWLFLPPNTTCVDFRIGANSTDHSVAIFAGTMVSNLTEIAHDLDVNRVGPNTPNGDTGNYSGSFLNTTDECGWKILRVRVYVDDQTNAYNPATEWRFDGGAFTRIPTNWFTATTSADDDTPPSTVPTRLATAVANNPRSAMIDENGVLWQIPADCNRAPTDTIGEGIYCIGVDEGTLICDPCNIDIIDSGCKCDDPRNTFANAKPQSVTSYRNKAIIQSGVDEVAGYTLNNVFGMTIVSGPTYRPEQNVWDVVYRSQPGVPYGFDVLGNTSGITVPFRGLCSMPDLCNCPVKPEICGDGLDNDCDGAVDAADSDIAGNCQLDCAATPVEIQGKRLVTNATVTTQVWTRAGTSNSTCFRNRPGTNRSPIGPGACPHPFDTTGGILPVHLNGPGRLIPEGMVKTLGLAEKANPGLGFSFARPDQVQQDAWLVVPPGITCLDLKVNNPGAYDGGALYIGNDFASLALVGANSFPPPTNPRRFTYDLASAPTLNCPDGSCEYKYVRVRHYTHDVKVAFNTRVQWNIGNGWQNIPPRFLQSVAGMPDSDANRPTSALFRNTAPFCAFRDTDGDLFLPNGQPYALNPRGCEKIMDSDCLNCPANLTACIEDCVEDIMDPTGTTTIDTFPECYFEVFRITPKDLQVSAGNGLTTVWWDRNEGNGFTGGGGNEPVFFAFDDFSEGNCPGCLPQHPTAINYTGVNSTGQARTYLSNTLGVADASIMPNPDGDGDIFMVTLASQRGGEQAQQDGWLVVDGNLKCIDFRLGKSGAHDASALYLGPNIDNMTFVGSNVNRFGENDTDTYSYEIPDNLPSLACSDCRVAPKLLRVRFYHHDDSHRSNTQVEWNIGNGFANIPTNRLYPVANQCDNTLPDCAPIVEGTPRLVFRDRNGLYFDYDDADIPDAASLPAGGDFRAAGIEVDRVFIGGCDMIESVCDPGANISPAGEICTPNSDLRALDVKGLCTVCDRDVSARQTVVNDACGKTFTDDGLNDGNYADTSAFRIFTYCPDNPAKQKIKLQFTEWDVHECDTFRIYNGDNINSNDYIQLWGVGVGGMRDTMPNAVGNPPSFGAGWAQAGCNNSTGCLTIYWAPKNDGIKGAGWSFNAKCVDVTPELGSCTIGNYSVGCLVGELVIGKVKLPTIKNVCAGSRDFYIEYDVDGEMTTRVVIDTDSIDIGLVKLGTHALNIRIKQIGKDGIPCTADDVVCVEKTCVFAVQADSNPTCNDEVIIAAGNDCSATVRPDDILENPNFVNNNYKIKVTNALGGKDADKGISNNNTDSVTVGVGIYNYIITDACGISCGGKFSVADYSAPFIIIPVRDTVVNCITDLTQAGLNLKTPNAIDNCDKVTVEFVSASYLRDGGSCDTSIVEIVWRATDKSGNSTMSSQERVVVRPDLSKLIKVPDVTFACGDDRAIIEDFSKTGVPSLQTGTIEGGVFEVKDTVELSLDEYVCGYILKKEDRIIPASDCGEKVFRFYELLDWCLPENGLMAKYTQAIFFKDTLPPVFLDTIGLKRIAAVDLVLDHAVCTLDANKIARPKATDNCDANPMVRLQRIARIEDGKRWILDTQQWSQLDCDSFELRWVAEDLCHEQTVVDTVNQMVVIKDETKPSVVLVDQLNISLPNESGARVDVEDVDAGSYDACGIKAREIRIKGSGAPWATFVMITCEYVHPDLQLEVRITDKKGNENIGWLDVQVEDKIKPICELKDLTAFCDQYHKDEYGPTTDANDDKKMSESEYLPLSGELLAFYDQNFGTPDCEDNLKTSAGCGELVIEQEYQYIQLPCGEGKILRRARATDWSENVSDWSVQTITINYRADWKVTFADDWTGDCGAEIPAPSILVENGNCDLLAYEVTEKRYDVPGDVCYKIERTYHVINWCKYQAGDPATVIPRTAGTHSFAEGPMVTSEGREDLGYFTYIQVLSVKDSEGPSVEVTDPLPCISGVDGDVAPYGEEDVTLGLAPYECDELKTWTASAMDCADQSVITWQGKLVNANTGQIVLEVNTNTITYPVISGAVYFAEFWAYDGCGNSTGEKGETITFTDCKKPTPYALNGIAIELMQTGMVQTWAKDLDQGSYDNCTDQSKLDFYIWHQSLGTAPQATAEVQALPEVITFTCDQLGTQTVHIYVMDEAENWDFVSTYVIVQDNMGACTGSDPMGMVTGTIRDANDQQVEGVTVAVNGATANTVTTTNSGTYEFSLPMNGDYTVTPKHNLNPLNGVSTFDLVLMSKHILGLNQFDTPYKYIAADINKSGSITAFDMVQLRQLILNIHTSLPQNDSWRFVAADYKFTTENPAAEAFTEYQSVNNLSETVSRQDFVAVKIGDINGNAQANSLVVSQERNTGKLFNFNVGEQLIKVGQTVEVAFTAKEIANIEGFQFTLNFAGLTLVDLTEGVAKATNFNTNLVDKSKLLASWNGQATATDELFKLTFTAKENGLLSEMLTIGKDLLNAEAYNQTGELMELGIDFSNQSDNDFELFQNTPNPFLNQTVIGFNLPKVGMATLTIMDIQGRVLNTIRQDFAKGYNEVQLSAKDLAGKGVIYYQLQSEKHIAVKKMVILE
ncbi:MAG: T9SS type A sorting domain-containing protein [Bacteroidota bacterium]